MKLRGFYRGDTYRFSLVLKTGGVVSNITGWQFTLTLKSTLSALPALQIQKTAGDDAGDDPLNGLVFIEIPSDISASLEPGDYFYDVQRTIPGTPPNVRTLLPVNPGDKIKVFPDVTV